MQLSFLSQSYWEDTNSMLKGRKPQMADHIRVRRTPITVIQMLRPLWSGSEGHAIRDGLGRKKEKKNLGVELKKELEDKKMDGRRSQNNG